jgi:hypothetical protein
LKTFLTQFRPAACLTPHAGPTRHMFLKVDRVERLRSTKKSQFGELFCRKRNVFVTQGHLTHPTYTHVPPPTRVPASPEATHLGHSPAPPPRSPRHIISLIASKFSSASGYDAGSHPTGDDGESGSEHGGVRRRNSQGCGAVV